MGVMSCARTGCGEIMCDTYIEDIGYICYKCKQELEDSKPESFLDVSKFMNTKKGKTFLDENGNFDLNLVFDNKQ